MDGNRYFTEKGLVALEKRAKSLVKLYNEPTNYPIKVRFCGFRNLEAKNKEELLTRLKELCDWTRGSLKEFSVKQGKDEKVILYFGKEGGIDG